MCIYIGIYIVHTTRMYLWMPVCISIYIYICTWNWKPDLPSKSTVSGMTENIFTSDFTSLSSSYRATHAILIKRTNAARVHILTISCTHRFFTYASILFFSRIMFFPSFPFFLVIYLFRFFVFFRRVFPFPLVFFLFILSVCFTPEWKQK